MKHKDIKDIKEEDLGYFIMYERFKQWLDAWGTEEKERAELLDKLSKWADLPKKSPIVLMLLAFIAGADVGTEITYNLINADAEKQPATEGGTK